MDRTALGQLRDGTYGLDITRPGYAVLSDADMSHLAFTTRWGHALVVHQTGLISRGNSVSFPDLGYVPLCEAIRVDTGTGRALGGYTINQVQVGGSETNPDYDTFVEPFIYASTSAMWFVNPKVGLAPDPTVNFTCRYYVYRCPVSF